MLTVEVIHLDREEESKECVDEVLYADKTVQCCYPSTASIMFLLCGPDLNLVKACHLPSPVNAFGCEFCVVYFIL